MGFLKNIFTRSEEQTKTNSSESQGSDEALLESILRGEQLTKEKALSIPAVSSSVDLISNLIAMLPIKLYKKEIKEQKVKVIEIKDDIRTKLLNEDTGDTLDAFQLKNAIVRDYLTEKGAYVFIEKKKNKFKSIRYIKGEDVYVNKNTDPIFKDGQYLINAKYYETYNFLTILRNTRDGFEGTSIISEISKSLETSLTTIMYELGLVQKGGGKKGFLKSQNKLSEEAMEKLKIAWKKYYDNKNENVVILNNGLEFIEGSNSSVELQINERKKTLSEDIKEVFHISNDYNTTIKNAVLPIISAIESALNKNFLLESEKGVFYFAFDTKKITQGSLKERYEAYKIASDTGWLSINEIRTEEDYSAIEGLDVMKMNLANVLYDTKTKKYYTPNTGEIAKLNEVDLNNEKEVK